MKLPFRCVLAAVLLLTVTPVLASQQPEGGNTIRLGFGDPLFEILAFHANTPGIYGNPEALPSGFSRTETFDYGYTGHFFAEYSRRLTRVVSLGFQADLEGIFWKTGEFDRHHQLKAPATAVKNWDLVMMPNVRFTYLETEWVRLYSSVGAGVIFAFDNQGDFRVAPSLNLNWVGAEVGNGNWGGTVELGALNSMSNIYHIYQLASRIISIGVYYKW